MRKLFVLVCLIASICAHNFHVKINRVDYTKHQQHGFQKFQENILSNLFKRKANAPRGGTEAVLNHYADQIFKNVQKLVVNNNLDPLSIPDLHSGFSYTIIITYFGDLWLTNGLLNDLQSIHRGGDVVVLYSSNTKYLQLTVPIAFDDLRFTYDYSAKIMGLGPKGGIKGKVTNLQVEAKIGFNVDTLEFSLDQFYVTQSGHIDFLFTGNVLIDWLLDLLSEVVTTLLKKVILLVVEDVVRGGLQSAIDGINEVIGELLNVAEPTSVASLFSNSLK